MYFSDKPVQAASGNFTWFPFHPKEGKAKPFSNKTKDILWFVSNCRNDRTNRLAYAQSLANVTKLKIDIIGKCGKNKTKGKANLQDYKFYLAFENSFCQDYITEKFFKVLHSGTIPIVRGAPMR